MGHKSMRPQIHTTNLHFEVRLNKIFLRFQSYSIQLYFIKNIQSLRLTKIFFCLLLVSCVVLISCNPNKDKWLNRNWHSLTGRFNVYFNGEVKFKEVMETVEKGHNDDFTKILEVFPYGDEATAKGVAGQLDIVLKKVSVAIQNHYVGRYTDDSYLLMGKAHYMKRDYYAAMEAFQYINAKYKDKGLHPISTTWIAKCYSGLKKDEEAEAVMGLLLSEEHMKETKTSMFRKVFPETSKDDSREMYATAADIAIKQRKYATASQKLTLALKHSSKKKDEIRYTYILGQLYAEMDSIQQAKKYFTKILSMLAPYEFEFNASISLARVYDKNDRVAVKKIRKSLKRMLKDDKNDGYYDQIWFELANLEYKEKNITAAIFDYKKSAEVQGKNPNQKALAYLALGSIYLDMPDYKLAQAYYDSTASTINKSYKDYDKIITKKTVLSDLINNLIVIETEDSLQELADLNQAEIDLKIDQWIAKAKQDSILLVKRLKDKKEAEKYAKLNPQANLANANTVGFGQQGSWYFYNPTIIASGAAEFFSQKKWGMRANEDYWRIAAMEKQKTGDINEAGDTNEQQKDTSNGNSKSVDSSTAKVADDAPLINDDRKAWVANVPFTAEQKAKSNAQLEDAFYNIGTIYDNKLDDSKEAIKQYEMLLYRYPYTEYEPEVLYKLYKLHTKLQQTDKAEAVKQKLITQFPESPYALIVQNKTVSSTETDANKEVVKAYEDIYNLYLNGEYEQVKSLKLQADKKYSGNTMQAKFDLVYALSVGKTESLDAFKAELVKLVALYPKTDVGERAQAMLDYVKNGPKTEMPDSLKALQPEFVIDNEPAPFYYVLVVKDKNLDLNDLMGKFTQYNEEYYELENLRINPMLSNEGYQLILVREFKEWSKVYAFYKDMKVRDAIKKRLKYEGEVIAFPISIHNFKKVLKEQKVDAYNKTFTEYEKSKPQN
jgi:tetratricopeptide (TPR) repeat protein